MKNDQFEELYEKYLAGRCTEEEIQQLESFRDRFPLSEAPWEKDKHGDLLDTRHSILSQIEESIEKQENHKTSRSRIWYAAASVILVVSSALLYFRSAENQQNYSQVNYQKAIGNDILPGTNTAVLTLSDGSTIDLRAVQIGKIASQNTTEIQKLNTGELAYRSGEVLPGAPVAYNTISTPRSGQYQVTLPDGTHVWLNAESKLKFPTVFSGLDRVVYLEGEAYFEVSKNPLMPFKVRAGGSEVKVLGTHFNVMAYPDEKEVNTTLVEGAVEVSANRQQVLIKPGESAVLAKVNGKMTTQQADIEQITAWKNGYFTFANENIQSIMRKVSRWYDVDVVFTGDLQNRDFTGTISRNENVSELLKMLQLTGAIKFRIDNKGDERRITVMP